MGLTPDSPFRNLAQATSAVLRNTVVDLTAVNKYVPTQTRTHMSAWAHICALVWRLKVYSVFLDCPSPFVF